MPRRVHIAGGSGTGKSTLAVRVGRLIEAPIHHLDYVARDFDANRVRTVPERIALVKAIAESDTWVTDGIHVGWTEVLYRRADVIVWLDHVRWPLALARVFRRSIAGGIRDLQGHGGRHGRIRPRRYASHLAELFRVSREIRAFDASAQDGPTGDGGSRRAIAYQLQPYVGKVVHCRSRGDIERFVAELAELRPNGG